MDWIQLYKLYSSGIWLSQLLGSVLIGLIVSVMSAFSWTVAGFRGLNWKAKLQIKLLFCFQLNFFHDLLELTDSVDATSFWHGRCGQAPRAQSVSGPPGGTLLEVFPVWKVIPVWTKDSLEGLGIAVPSRNCKLLSVKAVWNILACWHQNVTPEKWNWMDEWRWCALEKDWDDQCSTYLHTE